jgi:hypothetical protein
MPIVTFFSPFVHPESPLSPAEFDHYIWPAWEVHLIWLGFVATMFLVPALPVWLFSRLYRFSEQKGLLEIHPTLQETPSK